MTDLVQYIDSRTGGVKTGQLIKWGRKWVTIRKLVFSPRPNVRVRVEEARRVIA